jgi:hypothetical protein
LGLQVLCIFFHLLKAQLISFPFSLDNFQTFSLFKEGALIEDEGVVFIEEGNCLL